MAKEIKLAAMPRSGSGSSAARALRRQGVLPAVICGEKGARSVQLNLHDFEKMLGAHASENLIVRVDVGGQGEVLALLREVQHHPVDGRLLHADFVEISMTRKMRVGIRIRLVGDPEGVTQQGGILEQVLREVEVECLPGDLVEELEVDVSTLRIGDALLVRDLRAPADLTVLTAPDVAVAIVAAPKEETAPVAGAEAAPTEPEVIGKKKEEGEEEGGTEEESAKKEGKEARKEPKKEAKK